MASYFEQGIDCIFIYYSIKRYQMYQTLTSCCRRVGDARDETCFGRGTVMFSQGADYRFIYIKYSLLDNCWIGGWYTIIINDFFIFKT